MRRRECLANMAATALCAAQPAAASLQRLQVGLTPVILADQVAFLSRWGQYLASKVGVEVHFVARESYQAILDLLWSDRIDAAWICGYPFVRFEADLKLLAVPLYRGDPLYQAYLIRSSVAPDGPRGWGELKDRVLAYSDPLSNSGWLVAQAQLANAGIEPRELRRAFFAHGHRNVAEAVAARLAHAGAIDGYVWETMRLQGMPAVAKTEIVWKSEPFGFPPLVTARRANHPHIERLRSALLAMPGDLTGRELLGSLNLSGFSTDAASLFESIRRQAAQVPGSGVKS